MAAAIYKEQTLPSILITGANRGIGRTLCESYLADGWRVFATSRNSLCDVPSGAEHIVLEVADPLSIQQMAETLQGVDLDIIWNNAGVYLDRDIDTAQLDEQTWLKTFAINTIAPIKIAQALTNNLGASTRKVLAFTTSKMGSLHANGSGSFAYRSSKSALNMAVRSLAHDLQSQRISCLALHPGHVRTDMGGENGDIDTATSVKGMRNVIDAVDSGQYPEFNSRYLNYDGTTIQW